MNKSKNGIADEHDKKEHPSHHSSVCGGSSLFKTHRDAYCQSDKNAEKSGYLRPFLMYLARGSSPFSLAMEALVFFFGLYGL